MKEAFLKKHGVVAVDQGMWAHGNGIAGYLVNASYTRLKNFLGEPGNNPNSKGIGAAWTINFDEAQRGQDAVAIYNTYGDFRKQKVWHINGPEENAERLIQILVKGIKGSKKLTDFDAEYRIF